MQSASRGALERSAAAALVAIGIGLPLGAQSVRSIAIRQRESSRARIPPPSRAVIDSIATLMRALDNEPPGSVASAAIRRKIDALLPESQMFVVRTPSVLPRGWVGFIAQGPKHEMIRRQGDFIQYFAYPSIVAVDPESPAQRAGIAPGDVLIAYNGLDVRGRAINLTHLLEPDRKLSVTIRRDGATKDVSMTVAKAPENIFKRRLEFGAVSDGPMEMQRVMKGEDGPGRVSLPVLPRLFGDDGGMFVPGRSVVLSRDGAFGATLSNVSTALAKTLRLETGVLVNDVPDHTPASQAGMLAGDVIVNAAGQPIASLRALHELIARHLADQSIALQVMRDRKARTLTVSW